MQERMVRPTLQQERMAQLLESALWHRMGLWPGALQN